jgi:hypothetical protein
MNSPPFRLRGPYTFIVMAILIGLMCGLFFRHNADVRDSDAGCLIAVQRITTTEAYDSHSR